MFWEYVEGRRKRLILIRGYVGLSEKVAGALEKASIMVFWVVECRCGFLLTTDVRKKL